MGGWCRTNLGGNSTGAGITYAWPHGTRIDRGFEGGDSAASSRPCKPGPADVSMGDASIEIRAAELDRTGLRRT